MTGHGGAAGGGGTSGGGGGGVGGGGTSVSGGVGGGARPPADVFMIDGVFFVFDVCDILNLRNAERLFGRLIGNSDTAGLANAAVAAAGRGGGGGGAADVVAADTGEIAAAAAATAADDDDDDDMVQMHATDSGQPLVLCAEEVFVGVQRGILTVYRMELLPLSTAGGVATGEAAVGDSGSRTARLRQRVFDARRRFMERERELAVAKRAAELELLREHIIAGRKRKAAQREKEQKRRRIEDANGGGGGEEDVSIVPSDNAPLPQAKMPKPFATKKLRKLRESLQIYCRWMDEHTNENDKVRVFVSLAEKNGGTIGAYAEGGDGGGGGSVEAMAVDVIATSGATSIIATALDGDVADGSGTDDRRVDERLESTCVVVEDVTSHIRREIAALCSVDTGARYPLGEQRSPLLLVRSRHIADKCLVYASLYRSGFFITAGSKFGSAYLTYVDNPSNCHARFMIKILPRRLVTTSSHSGTSVGGGGGAGAGVSDAAVEQRYELDNLPLHEFVAHSRLGVSVRKIPVIAYVQPVGAVRGDAVAGMPMRAVLWETGGAHADVTALSAAEVVRFASVRWNRMK